MRENCSIEDNTRALTNKAGDAAKQHPDQLRNTNLLQKRRSPSGAIEPQRATPPGLRQAVKHHTTYQRNGLAFSFLGGKGGGGQHRTQAVDADVEESPDGLEGSRRDEVLLKSRGQVHVPAFHTLQPIPLWSETPDGFQCDPASQPATPVRGIRASLNHSP
jgi:hypothetical protein